MRAPESDGNRCEIKFDLPRLLIEAKSFVYHEQETVCNELSARFNWLLKLVSGLKVENRRPRKKLEYEPRHSLPPLRNR